MFRERRGWTVQRLAEECVKSGAGKNQLTAAAITNIETGRRDKQSGRRQRLITVDELLLLAHALAVPPVLLLLPVGSNEKVAVTPKVAVSPGLAWRWINGHTPPVETDEDGRAYGILDKPWREVALPLRLHERLQNAMDGALHVAQEVDWARRAGGAERQERAAREQAEALERLAEALNAMTQAGFSPWAIPRDWLDQMRDRRLLSSPDSVPVDDGSYPGRPDDEERS
jgi:transcriptional regulator with XRE-family HTH domain